MKTPNKNSERLVTKVFQDVFDKYDLMNDIMSMGVHRFWKKKFIDWLNPQENTILVEKFSKNHWLKIHSWQRRKRLVEAANMGMGGRLGGRVVETFSL